MHYFYPLSGTIPVSIFPDSIMYGNLSDPVHDTDAFFSICVASDDPHLDFYQDLATVTGKPIEVLNPVRVYAGKLLAMKEQVLMPLIPYSFCC